MGKEFRRKEIRDIFSRIKSGKGALQKDIEKAESSFLDCKRTVLALSGMLKPKE